MSDQTVYVYRWGNNPRRATLKGRECVIEARGNLQTVLLRFLDTGERVTTSSRAVLRLSTHRRYVEGRLVPSVSYAEIPS